MLRYEWIQLTGWVATGASGMLSAFARSKENPIRHFAPLAVLAATLLHGSLVQAAEPLTIDVHRDVNCGCCEDWIKYLGVNGFKVTDHMEADMDAARSRLSVPHSMGSCHTGVIDGKFVEDHVPAADILRLRECADLVGAAVPGIPVDSLGMKMGDRQDVYQVISLTRSGQTSVLAEYPGR